MNLDLLKKLVRLANNNPNENEANLAARKVCKLIEEGKFNFSADKPLVGQSNVTYKTPPRQYRQEPMHPNVGDWVRDFYKAANETARKRQAEYESVFYDEPKDKWVDFDWLGTKGPPNQKSDKPKRALQCKTCKQTKETIFTGLPELFECNDCQWSAYENIQKKNL